jgi:hypothetical protein
VIFRDKFLFAFLLIVPFFNILVKKGGYEFVITIICCFFLTALIFFRPQRIRTHWLPCLLILLSLGFLAGVSEIYSIFYLGKTNSKAIRFFGSFVPVFLFYVCFFNAREFFNNHGERLLKFYIVAFSGVTIIDYIILSYGFDISLQLMYQEDSLSYHDRPFGISGQPSVNSVSMVFFYTLLRRFCNFYECKLYFLLMVVGVWLQGSGSGFLALLLLLCVFGLRRNLIFNLVSFPSGFLFGFLILEQFERFNKISIKYFWEIMEVVFTQFSNWVMLTERPSFGLIESLLFGGVSSGIDFGPLFLISNLGLPFFVLYLVLICMSLLKTRNRFERWSLIILITGNLHYPVMFYTTMVFFLPLFLQNILFTNKSH